MSAEYGLCLSCGNIIDPELYKKSDNNVCPNMECDNEIIFIDENMIPIITILNRKGYHTRNCCSSHLWHEQLYIQFDRGIIIDNPPDGFLINKHVMPAYWVDGKIVQNEMELMMIESNNRYDWDTYSFTEKQHIIFNNLNILLYWANSLPDLNEGD